MEENRKEEASECGCVLCVLCVCVPSHFRSYFRCKEKLPCVCVCMCVCAKGIHLLLMAKRNQIAVPVSSRMAAVRVVNVCFFKGDAMKDSLFSVTFVS